MRKAPIVVSVLGAALCFGLLASSALAYGGHNSGNHGRNHHRGPSEVVTPPVVSPTPTPVPPTPPIVLGSNEVKLNAYTTGYSWYDNTPAGSAEISNPVIHSVAGGSGTYSDPITLAVGHTIANGKDTLDYAAGTRFYIPNLRKYLIVEDTCGDGNSPQNGPCHTGYKGNVWLDLYVGKGASKGSSDTCMNNITEVHAVIKNPASNYKVVAGDIAANCAQYGDTLVTQ